MSHIYPEIAEELLAIQAILEKIADDNAVPVKPAVRASILTKIRNAEQEERDVAHEEGMDKDVKSTKQIVVKEQIKVVPIWARLANAASFVLLAGLLGLWFSSQSGMQRIEGKVAQLTQEREELRSEITTLKNESSENQRIQDFIAEAKTKTVNLAGTDNSPESSVKVFWNEGSAEVMLKVAYLPQAQPEKQYQLWAIVDGKPQDMGVFDLDTASQAIQKLPKAVREAQAFAITLEKKGGSPTPTMSAMYVLGEV